MKKTKVNKAHYTLNGKMVDFAGWDLPVQFSGLSEEHIAVRTAGGIFDVSHMGEIRFKGPRALEAVQYITCNNVAKLKPGKIHYSGLMTENGCFVDDLLVYNIAENEYFLVVNAANIDKDYAYMKEKAGRFDVEIVNESEDYSQIAIQGPHAEKLLSGFTAEDLTALAYYQFTHGRVNDIDAIISRTGYTGEDGFEIYFKSGEDTASGLFLELAEKGKEHGIVPVGLGARDTLRLEAGMALYGNDIDDEHTVLEADLGWILKLKKKSDFLGKDVLKQQKDEGVTRKRIGFEIVGRGIARHGYPVYVDGKEYGGVTSGTYAPFLKKAVGMAYLPIDRCEVGTEFEIGIRNKRVTAKVVEMPFYKRNK
jgi:aminomethyltransferase